MRVFTAVRHSMDRTQYYGGLWSANFYPALRALGCEVVESKTDLLPTSRFMAIPGDFTPQELEMRARTTQRILDEVREMKRQGPVHLFLSYFYNAHFDPSGFDELRRLGIPLVNFYCNGIHQFENVAAIAGAVDFSWHPERDARAHYLAVGARPVWVQMGADPKAYHPVDGLSRESKVCFVGQRYADRDRWLARLVKADVPVTIYGSGWGADSESHCDLATADSVYLGRKQVIPETLSSYIQLASEVVQSQGFFGGFGRIVTLVKYRSESSNLGHLLRPHAKGRADDLPTTLGSYEVCLNLSNIWADGRPLSPLLSHVRLRDFEAPMCRACYLTGHSDEIAELYEIGKEIDTYRSGDELVDKARFYLSHTEASEHLREAGWQRARRDHTWERRFERLFQEIGIR
jgi:spore maturation protein CgeB